VTLNANRQLPTAVLDGDDAIAQIRQLATAEFDEARFSAFCRVGFTHHREILRKCKTLDERWYYILRCADEFWSVTTLKNHLKDNDFASYGRLPNNFALTIPDEKNSAAAVRSFRDEYLLDYIDIKESDEYEERDVENAIVDEIKKFVVTMGDGFAYIGNQVNSQILPFYGGSIVYRLPVEWGGGPMRIDAPCCCGQMIDVVPDAPAGRHELDLRLFGNRINTFGQLHCNIREPSFWWEPNPGARTGQRRNVNVNFAESLLRRCADAVGFVADM
jgi:predicted nuclease of restriction endonuclease-like (RecB) superfamily